MKNISFPKDMRGWSSEVVETSVIEAKPVESAKIDPKAIDDLLTQCEELIVRATEVYKEFAHKALHDSLIDLDGAKKSLKSISKN